MSPRALPKTLGGAMPSMSDPQPLLTIPEWLKPGLLVKIQPKRTLACFAIGPNQTIIPEVRFLASEKEVFIIRVSSLRDSFDFLILDTPYRIWTQNGLVLIPWDS